jgi:DtxR family manganese transport transcriptional regulator
MSKAKRAGKAANRQDGPTEAMDESKAHQVLIREQHSREAAHDYVEAIADLIDRTGEARAIDLAKARGVSHVTVIRTISRLQRLGLVMTKPYRSIFLTPAGREMAANAKFRHQTVLAFLEALGVPSDIARADAEGIEHHVSEKTLAIFTDFLKDSIRQKRKNLSK